MIPQLVVLLSVVKRDGMAGSKQELYQKKIDQYKSLLATTERFTRNISMLRVLVFVLAFAAVYVFARHESAAGIVISILLSIALFVFLVRLHGHYLETRNLQRAYLKLNEDELRAVLGRQDHFRDGAAFNAPEHYFANDLDIFGPGSLFQFLNRTASLAGYHTLGQRLKKPHDNKKNILETQEAVEVLSQQLEWRQKFLATGLAHKESEGDRQKIEAWSQSKPLFSKLIFRVVVVLVPALTAFMIVLLSMNLLTVQLFLLYLVVPWGIAGSFAFKVNNRHMEVSKTSEMLNKYGRLLKEIESLETSSELLKRIVRGVYHDQLPSSRIIHRLSAILTALDNRLNFVSWALLNGLFVWDILQMIRLENWQRKYRKDVADWFELAGEMDVLNSLANFHFNSTHRTFPEVLDGDIRIEAEDAGHPLIADDKRVDNVIHIAHRQLIIITGANMAGKSTYLRMIGVNLVLAMCGAPVCARVFSFVPVQIFSSIRTVDSLSDNESYFYAELKRLKAIIDKLRTGTPLFIILDEILKGTNSKDKHAGSEALIKQLISFKTSGIIATHDVLLGKMSDLFPDHISNYCFEVDIDGDQLHFDYRLRPGVSKNLNATILMREMGITI